MSHLFWLLPVLLLTLVSVLLLLRRKTVDRDQHQQTISPDYFLANQDFDLTPLPPCPKCNSQEVAKMLYGKPALTKQIIEGLESGKIISGGCLIHGGVPQWHCNKCNHDFGHLSIAPETTGEAS